MEGERQGSRYWLVVILLVDFLVPLQSVFAQQTPFPTLDEVLTRLEDNRQHYDTQIPNFFCDEHVASLLTYDKNHQSTTTDSVFRLERILKPDRTAKLVESREIKAVNGTPAAGDSIGGPVILSGVFSGGLYVVSLSQKACMRYALEPMKPEHPGDPYVVEFATLPSDQLPSGCVMRENSTGRVFIDPATMQVKRMELTAPHHNISVAEPPGVWSIWVDYAPVVFAGKTFWIPTIIRSKAVPDRPHNSTVYTFDARYSNCHKLEVTSRVLPFGESPKP